MGKYHLQKSSNGQFFWNLRADNGERILQSEMYTTKGAAIGGISSCKVNSSIDERYQRLTSTSSQPYFRLRAANHEVIGVSEMYSSVAARDAGVDSCKRNGPTSSVEDETGA